jgi:hypothetical protein
MLLIAFIAFFKYYRINRNLVQQEISKKNEQRALLESLSSTKQLLDVPLKEESIQVNAVKIAHL